MVVIKRDGREVNFQPEKITEAILKAVNEVDKAISDDAKKMALSISGYIEKIDKDLTVEEIQDIVENKLMASRRKDVAKAYILYRDKRSKVRENKSKLMKNISKKLFATDVENQNANVDEKSFGGRVGAVSDEVLKEYALNNCMSEMAKNNHLNNEIYIHDLSHYALGDHNCLSIPFDDLLAKGFNTRQTDVRPANSVGTAMQLVAVIFQLQSLNQFGGVSATHLDWTLVPYVRKSFIKHFEDGLRHIYPLDNDFVLQEFEIKERKEILEFEFEEGLDISRLYEKDGEFSKVYKYALELTEKETYQAAEGLYHNLNTLQSRSGNQLPFTSINYGTCTLPEGRMVTKALLNVSIEGLGKFKKTSVFPCGIFQIKKGINFKPGDPNYDLKRLAIKSTAQRLYPNYANCDWTTNKGYDENDPKTYVTTMGKETQPI